MSMPIAYRITRIVNPEWIHVWKLAHSDLYTGIFTANFIAPEPYIAIQMEVTI